MILADWIVIALIAFFCLLGILFGFGKGLKFFTQGIFGVFIAVIVCYTLGGVIYYLSFVQALLDKLIVVMEGAGAFGSFLITIHIELIAYYVVLFILVLVVRLIIVLIVKNVVESNNVVMKIINKSLGMVFFVCVLAVLALIVFQIIAAIGGTTSENFLKSLEGSFFRLDVIFEHNPLLKIFKIVIVKQVQVPVDPPAETFAQILAVL